MGVIYFDDINSKIYVGDTGDNDPLLNIYDINGQKTGTFGDPRGKNKNGQDTVLVNSVFNQNGEAFALVAGDGLVDGSAYFELLKYNKFGNKVSTTTVNAIDPLAMTLSDSQQKVYISDISQNKILVYNFYGLPIDTYNDIYNTTVWGGMDYDEQNQLLITINSRRGFIAIDNIGRQIAINIIGTLPPGTLTSPIGMKVSIKDNILYIADLNTNRILKFTIQVIPPQ